MNTSVNNTRENMNRVNNTAAAAKIEDFGQKIGGARKDYYAALKDFVERLEGVSVDALKKSALSKLVNLPDLARLCTDGAISEDAARAVWTLWRSVGHRPGLAHRLNKWAEQTAEKMAKIAAIMAGEDVPEDVRKRTDFQVMTAANWPAESFSFGRFEVCAPDWFSSSYCIIAGNRIYRKCAKLEEIPAALAAVIEEDSANRAAGPALAVYITRAGQYFVAVKGKPEIVLATFDDRNAAYAAVKENRAELIEKYNNLRTIPALRRDWNRPRLGEDWRKGENMTPETFAAVLPFRGVEFGNWVSQTERAALLNSAFDGFHDLASVWGLRPEDMTLCGSLAFAFASRGIPGAMAHYEAGHEVINLTKKSGAGCMAHEWFHAVDWFAGALDGRESLERAQTMHPADSERGRAAAALIAAIKKTDFYRRSENLANFSPKGGYWSSNVELAARGFEGVMLILLDAAGICSDFLVNVRNWDDFTAADVEHRSDIYPYPSAAEAAELLPYYLDFMRSVFGECVNVCDAAHLAAKQATEKAEAERAATAAKREREAAEKKAEEERKAQAQREEMERQEAEREQKAVEIAEILGAIPGVSGARRLHTYNAGVAVAALWDAQIITVFASAAELKTKSAAEIAAVVSVLEYKRKPARTKNPMIHARQNCVEFCKLNAEEFLQWIAEGAGCSRFAYEFAELAYKYGRKPENFRAEAEKMAAALARLKEAQAQKWAKEAAERENSAEPTNTKAEGKKPATSDGEAPAECLQVVEIADGLAVIPAEGYDYRATLYNKRHIKAHGCRWNKEAQQWQATTPEAMAEVRAWFGLSADEQIVTEPAAKENTPIYSESEKPQNFETEPTAPALPEWCKVGAVVQIAAGCNLSDHGLVHHDAEVATITRIGSEFVELEGTNAEGQKSWTSVHVSTVASRLTPIEKLGIAASYETTETPEETTAEAEPEKPAPDLQSDGRSVFAFVLLVDGKISKVMTAGWCSTVDDAHRTAEGMEIAASGFRSSASVAVYRLFTDGLYHFAFGKNLKCRDIYPAVARLDGADFVEVVPDYSEPAKLETTERTKTRGQIYKQYFRILKQLTPDFKWADGQAQNRADRILKVLNRYADNIAKLPEARKYLDYPGASLPDGRSPIDALNAIPFPRSVYMGRKAA